MSHHIVSKAAVRDYIYKELSELRKIILSRKVPYREEARKKRNFLEEQLRIVNGKDQWRKELDPTLVRLVLGSASKSPRYSPDQTSNVRSKESLAPLVEQPLYWDKCTEMDFRQLREFIEHSLIKMSEHGSEDRPRSKKSFWIFGRCCVGRFAVSDTENLPTEFAETLSASSNTEPSRVQEAFLGVFFPRASCPSITFFVTMTGGNS